MLNHSVTTKTRFSISHAANLLGLDRTSLRRRLTEAGHNGDKDITLREAHAAWTRKSEYDAAKLTRMRALAAVAEYERMILENKLVFREVMKNVMMDALLKVRAVVEDSELSEDAKAEIRKRMRDINLVGDEDGKEKKKWQEAHPEFGPYD